MQNLSHHPPNQFSQLHPDKTTSDGTHYCNEDTQEDKQAIQSSLSSPSEPRGQFLPAQNIQPQSTNMRSGASNQSQNQQLPFKEPMSSHHFYPSIAQAPLQNHSQSHFTAYHNSEGFSSTAPQDEYYRNYPSQESHLDSERKARSTTQEFPDYLYVDPQTGNVSDRFEMLDNDSSPNQLSHSTGLNQSPKQARQAVNPSPEDQLYFTIIPGALNQPQPQYISTHDSPTSLHPSHNITSNPLQNSEPRAAHTPSEVLPQSHPYDSQGSHLIPPQDQPRDPYTSQHSQHNDKRATSIIQDVPDNLYANPQTGSVSERFDVLDNDNGSPNQVTQYIGPHQGSMQVINVQPTADQPQLDYHQQSEINSGMLNQPQSQQRSSNEQLPISHGHHNSQEIILDSQGLPNNQYANQGSQMILDSGQGSRNVIQDIPDNLYSNPQTGNVSERFELLNNDNSSASEITQYIGPHQRLAQEIHGQPSISQPPLNYPQNFEVIPGVFKSACYATAKPLYTAHIITPDSCHCTTFHRTVGFCQRSSRYYSKFTCYSQTNAEYCS